MKPKIYGLFLCDECIYVGQAQNLFFSLYDIIKNTIVAESLDNHSVNRKYKVMSRYINNISLNILDNNKTKDYWINYYDPIFNIINPDGTYDFIGSDEDIDDFVRGLTSMDELRKMKVLRKSSRFTGLDDKWLNRKLYRSDINNLRFELRIFENNKIITWSKLKNLIAISGKYKIEEFKDGHLRCVIISSY